MAYDFGRGMSAIAAYTGDFEWYDERSLDPKEAQIDIYIAVDEKMLAKLIVLS
ncbi:hypothetical protein ACEQPO_16160 [Bacillus sp. SL00103]